MVQFRRILSALALVALSCPLVSQAHADTINYSGMFAADNSIFSVAFSTATTQSYAFTTTSFASGGFVPVLTLFNASGGTPLAFAETDFSDVTLSQLLGPGSYILFLTESPNVFTSTLSAGTLFSGSPTITGDLCGVSGGTFLNVVSNCSQRSSTYSLSVTNTAATPEPSTILLLLPPAVLLVVSQRRRQTAQRMVPSL